MAVQRLTAAQSVQLLRELSNVVGIPEGTRMFAVYVTIDERDGVTATIARDEPLIDSQPRTGVIQRGAECTDCVEL